MSARRIAVLTGSRSDYSLAYWTIRRILEDLDLELALLVTGSHLAPEFGLTVQEIRQAGFPIAAQVESVLSSDSGDGVATAMGLTTIKMAQVLGTLRPDVLLVQGDRTEVLATVSAALPLLVPVAHIHGGESSQGAIDESIRHAVTKLSHLHFVSTPFYGKRLVQMGEEEWRVHVCGAPGLEDLHRTELPSKEELERELGLDLSQPPLLVTQHPTTLSPEEATSEIDEVLAALECCGLPAVITYPNADAGGRDTIRRIHSFQARNSHIRVSANLGHVRFLGLMRYARAMVGNSSSGIIEAASLGLPVVNVGDRQRGRVRGCNVIDVPARKDAILHGIRQALDPAFRAMSASAPNIYDRGRSSETIVKVLKEVELGERLLQKRFIDLPFAANDLAAGAKV